MEQTLMRLKNLEWTSILSSLELKKPLSGS